LVKWSTTIRKKLVDKSKPNRVIFILSVAQADKNRGEADKMRVKMTMPSVFCPFPGLADGINHLTTKKNRSFSFEKRAASCPIELISPLQNQWVFIKARIGATLAAQVIQSL
jgi:hypothetical protein